MNGELNIKFQVSIYGDFSSLSPTEENIKKCIEGFFTHGLLPGNLQEFDTQSNKLEARLSLQSMRNGMNVNILKNRIDFTVTPIPGTPAALTTIEKFFEESTKISGQLKEIFELKYRRVGVIIEKFLGEMSQERTEELRSSFIQKTFFIFPELKTEEWSVRHVAREEFPAPVSQGVNIIYNLSKVKVEMGDSSGRKEFDTLLLSIDINIPLEKHNSGLSSEALENFLNKTLETQQKIYDNLTGVVHGAK